MKTKTVYVCSQCGESFPKWMGQCPSCKAWNTLSEYKVEQGSGARFGSARHKSRSIIEATEVKNLADVKAENLPRIPTGLREFDRVLGGGLVQGAVTLIGGDPGIGKSTLLLQVTAKLVAQGLKTLYVSGEESAGQVAMRAQRLELPPEGIRLMSEIELETIERVIVAEKPDFVVIDSIQTIFSDELESAPGSVAQVRECAARLTRLAKTSGTTLFFVGHVTKEGSLAGPRILEHIVDTVLYFEGDTHSNFRMIRAFKNRFGAVNELGVFGMTDKGLRGVSNPSAIFLSEHRDNVPGSVVLVTQEGTRPLLVEVQALVDETHSPAPRRLSVGLDGQRLSMLLAVLHRHAGLSCFDQDVFINAVGGMKVSESAADLAVLLAILSSIRNKPLPRGLVVFGEVGLAGEIRPAPRGQDRLREAAKLGFSRAIIPRANRPRAPIEGLEVTAVEQLSEAISAVQGMS
ncbi:DNA repair protein RadA [Mesosutterella sp. AGMB02718]|uniref:DNA repair protein RadA n=2 Tax=Mesosutterella TaxID=2494213 RepID=A0ABT7IJ26_9BURK|nr:MULTISPECIES: DNA repair protein RadA [unclassified Mesosutterella]MDL2058384.1 DNA repair protein RadA [Mesosutterella sp. AGMB02718]